MCSQSYSGITLEGNAVQVSVAEGKISEITAIDPNPELPRLLPSLVDLQHNGSLGYAYNNMQTDVKAQLEKVATHLISNGVGRVLATFTTAPYELLNSASQSIANVLKSNSCLDRLYTGIFHEGVFISPEPGWRGGHCPEYILSPDWNKLEYLNHLSGNRIKMVNIAPEIPGALAFIEKAVDNGIKVSLGHCNPNTSIVDEAVKLGATMVTHFGNGASPLIHRFKNPFWAFLDNEKLALGLIGDSFHLPPELVRTALKSKGMKKCFMVSDANIYSGCKPGLYQRLGGCDCIIEDNGFIHLAEQDILAGAFFQNNRSVEFLVNSAGLAFEEAWELCSTTPAELLGINLPKLQKGSEATFVQAKFAHNKLLIKKSVFFGKEYCPSTGTINCDFKPKNI